MSRWIDADALIEANKAIIDCEIDHPKYQDTVREIIDSAPTIEIVRCKECRHYNAMTNGCKRNPSVEPWGDNDFCSHGEREGE